MRIFALFSTLFIYSYVSAEWDTYGETLMHENNAIQWVITSMAAIPLDPWSKDGKLRMSFNVISGNLACAVAADWASFSIYDKAPRADRCMVTLVWASEQANEEDLPDHGENVVFTEWNPTLLTFDGQTLELFGGEGKRRQEKLSCKLQAVQRDGKWVKFDLEVVPKSDCGVRLNFGTGTDWSRDVAKPQKANNATNADHHTDLKNEADLLSFALYDNAPRADRCVVTIVWASKEADERDLPAVEPDAAHIRRLELFGGEGKSRWEELSCKLESAKVDGDWQKYDLEFVPKSDCGVRLTFGTGTTWNRDHADGENSNNATSNNEQHVEL